MRSTALNPYKPHRPDVEPPPNVYSDSVQFLKRVHQIRVSFARRPNTGTPGEHPR